MCGLTCLCGQVTCHSMCKPVHHVPTFSTGGQHGPLHSGVCVLCVVAFPSPPPLSSYLSHLACCYHTLAPLQYHHLLIAHKLHPSSVTMATVSNIPCTSPQLYLRTSHSLVSPNSRSLQWLETQIQRYARMCAGL